ncbi:MAG: hypothetical protein KAS32_10080 [Candidatus Peribacteraceae bacterium]|nr:hypothetical protein [Candidatus Peribacteraceae bacterium]
MDRGYIALYRKIQDHPFYKERRKFSKYEAWIDLLMEAQHKEEPREVILGMNSLVCNYGESLKSTRNWAGRWSWSQSKVKRFFKLLVKMKQICQKSETVTTRITILNYYKYDLKRLKKNSSSTHDRSVTDSLPKTDNNGNNVKHGNNGKRKIKEKDILLEYLTLKISTKNITANQNKIIEFYNYRQTEKIKGKKQPYRTEKGIDGLFRDMLLAQEKWGDLSVCLDIAMENNWLSPKPDYFNESYFKKGNGSWKI